MTKPVLVDTGPLVAYHDQRDPHHKWALAQWNLCRPPMFTCEAVVAEACYLLRKFPRGSQAVIEQVRRGVIAIRFRLEEEAEAVGRLLARYDTVPMSVADACLVRMSEQMGGSSVMTFDSDFRIYRKNGRQVIPTLMPH